MEPPTSPPASTTPTTPDGAAPGSHAVAERALGLVQQVSAALSTGDPLEGLPEAAACIAGAVGYLRAAVLVVPEEDDDMVVLVANSDEPQLTHLRFPLRHYPELQSALRSRRPVFAGEASLAPIITSTIDVETTADLTEAMTAEEIGSLLVLPLAPEGRALGFLALRSAGTRPPPAEEELQILRIAAQVLAAALKSARVFDWLREQTGRISLAAVAERRLARSVQQQRAFFDNAADGVIVVDAGLVVRFLNRVAEQLTGYSRAAVQGRSLLQLVTEPMRSAVEAAVRQAVSGQHVANFDFDLVTTSGERIRVSTSTAAMVNDDGAVVLTFRDVTEARALQDELRKTRDFLQRLIDNAVDAIIAADMRGRVLIFNEGAERIFGYRASEVVGRMNAVQLYPEGEARRIMAELRGDDGGGPGRLMPSRRVVLGRDGERVPVQLAASIIYEDGREAATVGIFSDLRDRLRIERRLAEAQERLQHSEKQVLIAELAGTAAHELNQPLTSVMGYTELLMRRLPPGDPGRRAVDIIAREADRMAEIVRKIGKITKYETKTYVGGATILDLDKSTT